MYIFLVFWLTECIYIFLVYIFLVFWLTECIYFLFSDLQIRVSRVFLSVHSNVWASCFFECMGFLWVIQCFYWYIAMASGWNSQKLVMYLFFMVNLTVCWVLRISSRRKCAELCCAGVGCCGCCSLSRTEPVRCMYYI